MFGEHASYVIFAYLISATVLALVVLITQHSYRRKLVELEVLESNGIRRRSANTNKDRNQ